MQPRGTVGFWYKPYPLSKKSGYFNLKISTNVK